MDGRQTMEFAHPGLGLQCSLVTVVGYRSLSWLDGSQRLHIETHRKLSRVVIEVIKWGKPNLVERRRGMIPGGGGRGFE